MLSLSKHEGQAGRLSSGDYFGFHSRANFRASSSPAQKLVFLRFAC
jgi:hypothetical protein